MPRDRRPLPRPATPPPPPLPCARPGRRARRRGCSASPPSPAGAPPEYTLSAPRGTPPPRRRRALATLEEAVGPEIVIMAVPWASVPVVLERSPEWEGRIIIDATHPPCREDGSPLGLDGASPGERIVALAPGAHVVMAFNTLPAGVLAQPPTEAGGRRVIFYSGDDARAKRKVASLISCLGFAAVDDSGGGRPPAGVTERLTGHAQLRAASQRFAHKRVTTWRDLKPHRCSP